MNEVGNYKYLIAYVDTIAKAIGLASLVLLILYFIREKIARKSLPSRILIVTLFPMLMVYAACYKIDTFKLSSYPAPVKIPDIALAYLKYSQPLKRRILEEKIHPQKRSEFKNIVWIIDESVAGTYLSVNGYEKRSTPYLDKLATQSDEFVNFGLVNSISNCSSTSNLFLRIGMNPLKYRKSKISELPTIFQYAKRAGFTTWLFDSQTRKDHLQNYLTPYDKETIDHFETLGAEVERVDRDERFLNRMIELVNNQKASEKNFIVLVKYGAHFPYLLTYDQHFSPFAPVVENSYGGMNMEHREEVVNTYLNSLYFNVDVYFKKMLAKIDLNESIVFYTSDHGQNILETKGLTRTHCNSVNVVKNEVTVPLFLFTNKAKKLFPKKENFFYSQIQMFPTTLSLLGYSDGTVEKYGKTLKRGFMQSNARHYILSSSEASKVYE
jgi:glucan phosphoethanolaminetransferase (alkaline phosphatase superfamily)